MTNQSVAVADSEVGLTVHAPTGLAGLGRFYWSLRREFWESRYLYMAPLGAAALYLLGFLVRLVRLRDEIRSARALDALAHRVAIAQPYEGVAGLLMVIGLLVAAFYCVEALYGERRDRSTLFWKSLPVSDRTTVLAKASVPLVWLPLLTVAITVATQVVILLLSGAVLAGTGETVATLWNELAFPRMALLLLYHLVTVHALWIAPAYGWLLLVSAWAPSAPVAWAFVPPVALCYLEKIAFNTTHLVALLRYRLFGNGMEALYASGTFTTDPLTQLTPGRFLTAPDLWIGLGITAAFLAAAAQLRRSRGAV